MTVTQKWPKARLISFNFLCQGASQAFERMFDSTDSKGATLTPAIKHKEKGLPRRKLDEPDGNLFYMSLKTHQSSR